VDQILQFAISQIHLSGVLCKAELSASNTKGTSRTTWHLYMVRPALELAQLDCEERAQIVRTNAVVGFCVDARYKWD